MKKLQTFIQNLMLLVLTLSSFTPVIATAQTLSAEPNQPVALTSLKKVATEATTFQLTVQVTNTTETTIQKELTLNQGTTLLEQAPMTFSQQKLSSYTIGKEKIRFQIAPATSEAVTLTLTATTVQPTLAVSNGIKTLSVATTTEEPATTSATVTSTTTSEAASEAATSATTEETILPTTGENRQVPQGKNVQTATIIKDIKITDKNDQPFTETNPADLDGEIKISFDWGIPDDVTVKKNDTFEFNLPKEIAMYVGDAGVSGALGEFGTFLVTKDGHVTMTFNENAENGEGVKGNFHILTYFDKTQINGSTDQIISFPINDTVIDVPVKVKPKSGGASLSKDGHLDKNYNSTTATWMIDVNTSLEKLANGKVLETLPTSLSYVSAKVYLLAVDVNGQGTPKGELAPTEYTISSDGKEITLPTNTRQAYRIVYETTIKDSASNTGNKSFQNTATLVDGEKTVGNATKTITATYGVPLAKSGSYNADKQEITWTINYNYNQGEFAAGQAFLTDLFSDNSILGTDSLQVFPVTINAAGQATTGTTPLAASEYVVTPMTAAGKTGFKLAFPNGTNQAYQIKYVTKNVVAIPDTLKVDNTVSNSLGNEVKAGTQTMQQGMIVKDNQGIDADNHLVKWRMIVNKTNQMVKQVTIGDKIGPAQVLNKDSFVVKTKEGVTLTPGVDYVITYPQEADYQSPNSGEVGTSGDKDAFSSDQDFRIDFIGDHYTAFKETIYIEYNTKYTSTKVGQFTNDVKAHYMYTNINTEDPGGPGGGGSETNSGWIQSKKTSSVSVPSLISNSGSKGGVYNAQTKRNQWTIIANYNKETLKAAKITDPILGPQTFIPQTLEVRHYTLQANGAPLLGEKFAEDEYTVEAPSATNNQTLTIKLKDGLAGNASLFAVYYETSVEDHLVPITYQNIATYENAGEKMALKATTTVKYGGRYAIKDGAQQGDQLNYSVTLNPSQSTIEGFKVTDRMGVDQTYLEDSLKIYETTVTPAGDIQKSAQELPSSAYKVVHSVDKTTGESTLVVQFNETISRPYIMTYGTKFLVGNGESVTNSIDVEGTNLEKITNETTKTITVKTSSGGGTGSSIKGSLTITKKDEDQKVITLPATFVLLNSAGEEVRSGATVDGKISFSGLRSGEYTIKETVAPDGYAISNQLNEGVSITLKNTSDKESENTTAYEAIDPKTKIKIKKVSETGEGLEATFNLRTKEGKMVRENLITNAAGELIVEGLLAGDYLLTESDATKGYLLNTQSEAITVDSSEQVHEVTFINYLGSVTFKKTDAAGKGLPNAQFKLVDKENKLIKADITSDENGVVTVTDLAPGDYQFIETQAPTGYLLNTEPLPFTIATEATGKPETVVVTTDFINYQGQAELLKVNEKNQPLTGAEFKLVDAAGKVVKEQLLSDEQGKVFVEDLAPGDYQFIETKAPTGYLLNTEPLPFTIATEAAGKPEIVVATTAFINYQGQAELLKVNEKNQPLAGAEFKLVDATGKVLKEQLRSDKQGKVLVEDLAPGEYQFIETKAPTGYKLNATGTAFTIETSALGKPAVVVAGTLINQAVPATIKPPVKGPKTPTKQTPKPVKQSTNQQKITNKKELPKTNEVSGTPLQVLGIVIIAGLAVFYYQKRRKQTRK